MQVKLDSQAQRHKASAGTRTAKATLTGKLFDANGEVMTPSFSRGRSGGVYRYYVSASLQQGAGTSSGNDVRRLPAPAIEALITDTAARWMPREEHALDHLLAIRIEDGGLVFECPAKCADDIVRHLRGGEQIIHSSAKICRIKVPVSLPLRGGQRLVIADDKPDVAPDPTLIAGLRRAHSLLRRDRKSMPMIEVSPPIA